jgi:predicted enzyme related to lactoylglutathione lyase
MAESFTFTKVMVSDLETASGFYEEVFGLRVAHRIETGTDGDRMEEVFLATGPGPTLALVKVDRVPPSAGEVVLGFSTSDITALFGRADQAGGTIERPPLASAATHGYTVGILTDPYGHRIEVVEVHRDGRKAAS